MSGLGVSHSATELLLTLHLFSDTCDSPFRSLLTRSFCNCSRSGVSLVFLFAILFSHDTSLRDEEQASSACQDEP